MQTLDPRALAVHDVVGRLQTAYGDAVSRRDWPAVTALFHPDARISLDLGRGEPRTFDPEELAGFVDGAVARFDVFLFTVLNRTVEIDGDAARGRVYLAEVRQDADGHASVAYGLYTDRYTEVAGDWRIAERSYTSLARTAAPGAGADLEVVARPR